MLGTTSHQPALFPVVCLVGATACWGAGTVVTKQVLDDVAPLSLPAVQLAASCAYLGLMHVGSRHARAGSIRRTRSRSAGG